MKQIEFFGEGRLSELAELLKKFEAGRIFLVTGKNSFSQSGAESKVNELLNNILCNRFIVTTECPDIEFINSGINEIKRSNSNCVVAVGGGNVIDTAKALNILSVQDLPSEEYFHSDMNPAKKGLPLIAIPTTSGSGSEATHFAVVYSGEKKFSLASEYILPDATIVDPELTYSLSSYQTAVSGIDAFCQAVESLWASGSTAESRQFAESSISLITKNFNQAVQSPDVDSRRNMSLASNLAGKAINISKTTAPHAVSYTMTRKFGIPHGQAVCLTLGEFMRYNYEVSHDDCNDKRGCEHVRSAIDKIIELLGANTLEDGVSRIRGLVTNAGLKTRLRDFGIGPEADLEKIAANTNTERLANNPRSLTHEGLLNILKRVY